MLFCCMAAALLLACSNDKSDGEGREPGVETELNGTQLGEGTTLYGLVTDTSGNPVQGVVVSDGYNCVETDANGVYQMIRYKKARFVWYSTPAGYEINTSADNYPLYYAEIVHKNIADRHDFVLKPLAAPETDFTLLCIADPQCASTADISDHIRLVKNELPRLRSSAGNRFSATSEVKAGVISKATDNRDTTTISGVTAKMTIRGTSTALRPPNPTPCNHSDKVLIRVEDSTHKRTVSSTMSQYR